MDKHRYANCCALLISFLFFSSVLHGQVQLLDDFESLDGWRAIPSEGAGLIISSDTGKTGRCMVMQYDLSNVSGYTIVQKDFPLTLPPNYVFTFDMRANIPINNFEFKLLDDDGSVFWIKKLNIHYPKSWEKQRIKKRHISFAWGPAGGGEIRKVAKIEFVVSSGLGGKGNIYIDNFRIEPIDDNLARTATAEFDASSIRKGAVPSLNERGTVLQHWAGSNQQEWLSINFNHLKEIGGIIIDWDSTRYASSYNVSLSEDGKEWFTAYSVTGGNGGRDCLYLPEKDARHLRINFLKTASGNGFSIKELQVKGAEYSHTPNEFFASIAHEAPKGLFPQYFLNQQCYWTVVGVSGDAREALINEAGAVEVDQQRFSLEPFLYVGNKLISWSDVTREQSLMDEYLPIPSVVWKYGSLELTIRAFAAGAPGKSLLMVTYSLHNKGDAPPQGRLFIALRPFQVNPPSQWLNRIGGATRIDSIRSAGGFLYVQDKTVIPLTAASAFGATSFDSGDITEYLQHGLLPPSQAVKDANGFASAALEFNYNIESGSSREFHIAVPFHAYDGSPTPNMSEDGDLYVNLALASTTQYWTSQLDRVHIQLPPSAQAIINTIKSNLAYIFINRDGPGIQPGSRSYERSWIRDGSLTSTALLELGIQQEVREYIDWYAKYQFPNGKIPCVVDQGGGDPTNEHDSHGQFIYLVMQYYNFTRDTAWLKTKYDNVVNAVRFIQSLRAERKTDVYKNGTPEQRACYGLVPESISHEGYSAKPMHSYWDDFFILRGLKDATTIATILGDVPRSKEFAAEQKDFSRDLYASIRLAMKNHGIDYIPGCVELGDFDATSTTIGVQPVNELGVIPEPQLHNTFDRYYEFFKKRRDNSIQWDGYTPYENRIIGTFVLLDQKERAHEVLSYFMNDRRPPGWNHWAEVVHRDPLTPKFIGDMPHTWCGSDFIRSVRSMFVYEREQDDALVVGAGIADAWVKDPAGIRVQGLPTYYGPISYTVQSTGNTVNVSVSGNVKIPRGKIILKSPLQQPMKSVTINGARVKVKKQIVITSLPSNIVITY